MLGTSLSLSIYIFMRRAFFSFPSLFFFNGFYFYPHPTPQKSLQNLRICSFASTCMASTSLWWRPGTKCSSRIWVRSTSMELAAGRTRLGIVPPKCPRLYGQKKTLFGRCVLFVRQIVVVFFEIRKKTGKVAGKMLLSSSLKDIYIYVLLHLPACKSEESFIHPKQFQHKLLSISQRIQHSRPP